MRRSRKGPIPERRRRSTDDERDLALALKQIFKKLGYDSHIDWEIVAQELGNALRGKYVFLSWSVYQYMNSKFRQTLGYPR